MKVLHREIYVMSIVFTSSMIFISSSTPNHISGRHKRSLLKLMMHIYYDPTRIIGYNHAVDLTKAVVNDWKKIIPTILFLPITANLPTKNGVNYFLGPVVGYRKDKPLARKSFKYSSVEDDHILPTFASNPMKLISEIDKGFQQEIPYNIHLRGHLPGSHSESHLAVLHKPLLKQHNSFNPQPTYFTATPTMLNFNPPKNFNFVNKGNIRNRLPTGHFKKLISNQQNSPFDSEDGAPKRSIQKEFSNSKKQERKTIHALVRKPFGVFRLPSLRCKVGSFKSGNCTENYYHAQLNTSGAIEDIANTENSEVVMSYDLGAEFMDFNRTQDYTDMDASETVKDFKKLQSRDDFSIEQHIKDGSVEETPDSEEAKNLDVRLLLSELRKDYEQSQRNIVLIVIKK